MNPLVHASSVSGPTMLIIRTLASVCTQGFFTLGEKLGHLSDVMGSHDLYESRLSILSIFFLCLFFSVKCTFTNLKEKKSEKSRDYTNAYNIFSTITVVFFGNQEKTTE